VQEGKVAVRILLADSVGAVVRTADGALDAGGSPDRQRATGLIETMGLAHGAYLLTVEAIPPKASDTVRHAIPIRLDAATTTSTAAGSRHLVVAHGPSSRHAAAGTFVIRTEEEWRAFWRHLPTRQAAPPIDFDRVALVAIVAESSAGDAPAVQDVVPEGSAVVVRWRTQRPAAATNTSAVSKPFVVVALPREVGTVRFQPVVE
jgi:hypothetical protein